MFQVQRRRAVVAVVLLFALVLLLPVVFALWPELDRMHVVGVPLSWLMVVVIPFPAMVALAVWQLRRAEQPEDHS